MTFTKSGLTAMADRTFVDTNVFVYSVDESDPAKQARAQQVLLEAPDIVVSTQVMNEFYVITTRKLAKSLAANDAAAIVEKMAAYTCVPVDPTLVHRAVRAGQQWQLSHWDALMVASAWQALCGRLLTEDLADGAVYDGVRIESPFRDISS